MSRDLVVSLLFLLELYSCSSAKKIHDLHQDSISQLKFLSEYDIPNGAQYKGTTIGGLSGIDYDSKRGIYYLISDDRSSINPARFYTSRVYCDGGKIDSIAFINVTTLKDRKGASFPNSDQDPVHTPDPEAIRHNPGTDELVWSSEGERILRGGKKVLEDPSVIMMNEDGAYRDSFLLPSNMHMSETENGPRQNGVFEGMTFSGDGRNLYVSLEEPLYQDGLLAGLNDSTAWIRIIKFDVKTKKPVAQYAYQIDPVAYPPIPSNAFKLNGVSDIMWLSENKLLVIERSFSTGRPSSTIRVFLADMNDATNIESINSLKITPASRPVRKKLLLNMDELGRYIDNIEGVSFGPTLSNGHRTLIFVSDNNFSKIQKTQFLVFEVIP